jgi:hypothetical protein
MITVKWHTDTPLTASTAIMTCTSVFNPLFRSPARTQLLEFNCLPLLHYWLQHPQNYISKTINSLPNNTPSSALGHHYTPLSMLSLLISTQSLQHCKKAVSGVQNIMTNLAYDHINDSFLIQCYTKTEIIGSMQGQIGHLETQLVKRSHSSTVAHSRLVK